MNNKMTIGVDHGYSMIKTSHCAFPAGLEAYDYEPYTSRNVLEYGGKFYVVGSERQPLQKDKTASDDYYLMTLAAIAEELRFRNAEYVSEIRLAAGLPLTSFGREKDGFYKYLVRDGKPVSFRYEDKDYTITITDVSLFPQGYAAILTRGDLLREPSVVLADIGGWTLDLMRINKRIPESSSSRSLELGVIRCLDEIEEQVRRKTGLSVTPVRIESVLNGEPCVIRDSVKEIIHEQAEKYVRHIISSIIQSGPDIRAMPAIFLGGGARLIGKYGQSVSEPERPVILDDIALNAKAFELLAERMTKGEAGV